ncbi:asparagine synthase (glutamine-hydrolyzing) [bacterium]|nr:asparagine synthase (glutamine-hydrolyzing) [bacterium]
MCSIAGGNISRTRASRISGKMRHRGPDHSGIFEDSLVTLSHNRLSIIDTSSKGNQPMEFEDLIIIFNGEIYNYKELRRELQNAGFAFCSKSDTEVLLKCYSKYGSECVKRFNGDFAFCIYDKRKRELFLARDRVGNKPLYFYHGNGEFIFASELRAFEGLISLSFNERILGDAILFGLNDYGDHTIYDRIRNLQPAHFMRYDLARNELEIKRYWKLEEFENKEKWNENGFRKKIDEFENLLNDSVKIRLIADVPVGTLLSGGIDSSLIAFFIKENHHGDHPYFTSSFPKFPDIDETYYAELLSKSWDLKLIKVFPTEKKLKSEFDNLVTSQFDIFRSLSVMSQYLTMKAVKEHVKVILSGQGADELFGGYYHYMARYLGKNPHAFKDRLNLIGRRAFEELKQGIKLTQTTWKKKYLLENDNFDNLKAVLDYLPQYKPNWDLLLEKFTGNLSKALRFDIERLNLPQLLRYEDRNAMAFSIENRTPFTDYRVIEFANSIPLEYKFKNGVGKYFLREFSKRILPKEIFNRIDKKGFEAPEKQWMRILKIDETGNLVKFRLALFEKLAKIVSKT